MQSFDSIALNGKLLRWKKTKVFFEEKCVHATQMIRNGINIFALTRRIVDVS